MPDDLCAGSCVLNRRPVGRSGAGKGPRTKLDKRRLHDSCDASALYATHAALSLYTPHSARRLWAVVLDH